MTDNQRDPFEEDSAELSSDPGVPEGTPEAPDLDEDLVERLQTVAEGTDDLERSFDDDDSALSGDDSAEGLSGRAAEEGPDAGRELSSDPDDDAPLRDARNQAAPDADGPNAAAPFGRED